jgi:hypothetical protein
VKPELTPLNWERQFKPFLNLNTAAGLWTTESRTHPRKKIPPFGGIFSTQPLRTRSGHDQDMIRKAETVF